MTPIIEETLSQMYTEDEPLSVPIMSQDDATTDNICNANKFDSDLAEV